MKRIMIFGGVGTGKSTFARKLSEVLKIKCFSTDSMVYDKNWKKYQGIRRERNLRDAVKRNKWIIEGKYSDSWLDPALKEVDTIILLHYKKRILFKRILKRFNQGRKEKSAYGRIGSLLLLLYWALAYDPSSHLKLSKIVDKNKGNFIVIDDTRKEKEFLRKLIA